MVLLFRVVGLNPAFSKVLFGSVRLGDGEEVSWEKSAGQEQASFSPERLTLKLLTEPSGDGGPGPLECGGQVVPAPCLSSWPPDHLGSWGTRLPVSWSYVRSVERAQGRPCSLPVVGLGQV